MTKALALVSLLLAAQCEQRQPAPPVLPPPAPPVEPVPVPEPEPEPPPPRFPSVPEWNDQSRCAEAWRNAHRLGCELEDPPCEGRPACVPWLELCKVVEANGVSAGSKCIARASSCVSVRACIGQIP